MKPSSDLNSILQNGFSFKYERPPGWGMKGVQDVTISTHQIGELILTSGRLLAWDLLIGPDERYFFKKTVTPGTYPVVLSIADFHPTGETRVACAMLVLGRGPAVSWDLAAINNPDTESNADIDQYDVDSGTGSFMDVDTVQILNPLWESTERNEPDKFEEFCDEVLVEMEKHSFGSRGTANWANITLSEGTGANVVTFSSGWGDGGYASFWGYDAHGDLTCLVTDFDLFITS